MLYRDEITDKIEITWYLQCVAEEISESLTTLQRLKLQEVLKSPRSGDFIATLLEVLEKDLQETMLPDD